MIFRILLLVSRNILRKLSYQKTIVEEEQQTNKKVNRHDLKQREVDTILKFIFFIKCPEIIPISFPIYGAIKHTVFFQPVRFVFYVLYLANVSGYNSTIAIIFQSFGRLERRRS